MRVISLISLVVLLCHPLFSQVDTTIYSFDGKTHFNGQVINGKQVGTWKELDSNGELIRKIQILDNKGNCIITPNFKDTTYSGYFYGYFIQNKVILHGEYQIINLSKKTKTEGNYFYGQLKGQKRYYVDGNLNRLDFYSGDSLKYLSLPFNKNGEIIYISGLNNKGFQTGLFVDFNDSMQVTTVGYFDNGCKVGKWSYYTNGVLTSKGIYYPDFLHLKSINDTLYLVNKNDSLAKEIYPLDVIKSFDINKQVLYLKHGKWYYFDSLGNVVKTECYEKGELILDKKRKKK